jgi:hypothetical protein
VERPAGRGAGADADVEVKCPGLLIESKIAAASYRVFGPRGNGRHCLDPVTDQRPVQREQQSSC